MTEIPEHLLKRSKSAKASKSGADDSGDAAAEQPTAEASAGDAAPAPAAAAPAAPAGFPETASIPTADLPNLDPEPEPAKPEPAYVTAGKARRKIPVWALPVVAALPVWAYSFAGTMQQPVVEDPLLVESALFYTEAGCAGCHGGTGGGIAGNGYQLSDGEVLATFPSPVDQMVHVARGSAAIAGEAYGAERADGRRVSGDRGQMPAQDGLIPMIELEMIVFHERAILSGEDQSSPEYVEWMDHMRELYEAGDEEPIDMELLLACADPAITPGATGNPPAPDADGNSPCPGPQLAGEGEDEAAAG